MVVMEEAALPERADKDVLVTIVVVIADGDAHAGDRDCQCGASGRVSERSVVVVVIQLQRGCAMHCVPGKVSAVDQENVGIAVVVVTEEGAAGAEGLGKMAFAESAIVVREVKARRAGDIGEAHRL